MSSRPIACVSGLKSIALKVHFQSGRGLRLFRQSVSTANSGGKLAPGVLSGLDVGTRSAAATAFGFKGVKLAGTRYRFGVSRQSRERYRICEG